MVFADVGSVYMRYGMLGEPISNNKNQRDGRVVPSLVMKVKGCLLVVLFAPLKCFADIIGQQLRASRSTSVDGGRLGSAMSRSTVASYCPLLRASQCRCDTANLVVAWHWD